MDSRAAPSPPLNLPATSPARAQADRRSPLRLACAAILCGLGLAAAGVTLVRAADDTGLIEFFRSDALRRAAAAVRLRERPAPTAVADRPDRAASRSRLRDAASIASRKAAARKVKTAAAAAAAASPLLSRRTMCVRVCDGYTFPVGLLRARADLSAHAAACEAQCPGAETRLYTLAPGQRLDDPANARSVQDGSPYRRLKTALLFRTRHVANCSCQGPDNIATRLPILLDPTLRAGDVVIDERGAAQAFAGTGRIPHSPRAFADYRRSPALTRQAQAQVDRVVGTSQRQAVARAYERSLRIREASLRTREASLRTTPFREIAAPAGSGAGVRAYQVSSSAGTIDPSGARIILVR